MMETSVDRRRPSMPPAIRWRYLRVLVPTCTYIVAGEDTTGLAAEKQNVILRDGLMVFAMQPSKQLTTT